MKLRFTLSFLLSSILLQACNAGPASTRPVTPAPSANTPQASTASAVTSEDQKYANYLVSLTKRNPQLEAQQAISRGDHFLLGYYSGRAGLKMPGLSSEQQTNQRCRITTVDGLGDVIYGENHLKYRIAMRNFAKAFNTNMLSVCL